MSMSARTPRLAAGASSPAGGGIIRSAPAIGAEGPGPGFTAARLEAEPGFGEEPVDEPRRLPWHCQTGVRWRDTDGDHRRGRGPQ